VIFIEDNARRVDISGEPHEERGFLQFIKEIRYRIKIAGERSQIRARISQLVASLLKNSWIERLYLSAQVFSVGWPEFGKNKRWPQ
jgi:hypothetical protein